VISIYRGTRHRVFVDTIPLDVAGPFPRLLGNSRREPFLSSPTCLAILDRMATMKLGAKQLDNQVLGWTC